MKKFLFLLIFLPLCQREYRFCWDCELIKGDKNPINPVMVYSMSRIEYCDKTEKEINQIIAGKEHTIGIPYTHMTCRKR